MLKGKKVLITSGGTLEKWDNVRGHTNLSKGIMGTYLAEAAYAAGAEVIYMHGYFTKLPAHQTEMRLVPFEGIEDLGDKLKKIVQAETVDFVIMAVAGSDWLVDKVFDQQGNEMTEKGKMPSDEPPIRLYELVIVEPTLGRKIIELLISLHVPINDVSSTIKGDPSV